MHNQHFMNSNRQSVSHKIRRSGCSMQKFLDLMCLSLSLSITDANELNGPVFLYQCTYCQNTTLYCPGNTFRSFHIIATAFPPTTRGAGTYIYWSLSSAAIEDDKLQPSGCYRISNLLHFYSSSPSKKKKTHGITIYNLKSSSWQSTLIK